MFGPSFIRFLVCFLWHFAIVIMVFCADWLNLIIFIMFYIYGMYFHNGLSDYINREYRHKVINLNKHYGIGVFILLFIFMVDFYFVQEIFFYDNILIYLIILPLFAIGFIASIPKHSIMEMRVAAFIFFLLIFSLSTILYLDFASNPSWLDHKFAYSKVFETPIFLNIQYALNVDGLSIWFVLLTTFLFPIVALVSWESVQKQLKLFFILLFLLEFFLINIFLAEEIVVFYIMFEGVAIPMFLLVGLWGSTDRRIYAAFKFFFYTLFGSILMFSLLIWLYYVYGTTNINVLELYRFSFVAQVFMFIAFFSSFAVKIPMMPVHLWLPEAHVEAPTGVSVLLAGILLKTGGYAFIRFVLPLCNEAAQFASPLVYLLSIISIVYGSFAAIVQTDLKKMIAYSSVAHMNLATIGIFSGSLAGLQGALYLMLTHGIVSSGLFICVGVLYDRYHTRVIRYYGGLISFMPWFGIFFFLLILGNISFPSTGGFVPEFILLYDIFSKNMVVSLLAGTGIIFGAIYSVWLYNRIMFGYVSSYVRYFADINFREFLILLCLVIFMFIMGIYPSFFMDIVNNKLTFLNELVALKFL